MSRAQQAQTPPALTPAIYFSLWLLLTLVELGWSGPGAVLLSPMTALALLAGNSYNRRPRRWIERLKTWLMIIALLLCVLTLFSGRLLASMMLLVQLALIALCMTLTLRREVFILLLASVGLVFYAAGYAAAFNIRMLLPLHLTAAVLVLMQLQGARVRATMRRHDGRGGLLALVPVVLSVAGLSLLLYWLLPRPPALHYALFEQPGTPTYDDAQWQARAQQQAGQHPTAGGGQGAGGSGSVGGNGGGSESHGAGPAGGDAGLSREPLLSLSGAGEPQPPRRLMRVESPQPVWLRTLVFDHFNGESWSRSAGSDRYYQLPQQRFERQPGSADPVLRQRIEIVAEMDGVLPLTPVVHRIQLPSRVLRSDHLGALYLPGQLQPGLTYLVESTASSLDGRVLHSTRYEPATGTADYLQLPASAAALCPAAEALAAGREPVAAANAIEEYLLHQVATVSPGGSASLEAALQAGQMAPMQKLSAFVLMLRCLGTPARLVSGYRTGLQHPLTGAYEIGSDDAVVWAEAGLPALGWARFSVSERGASPADPRWLERSLAYVERRLQWADTGPVQRLMLQGAAALLRLAITLRNGIQQAPLLAGALLLLLLTLPLLLWRYRRPLGDWLLEWRLRRRLRRQPELASIHLFAALESWFARRGQRRYPQETAQRYGRRLALDNPWLGDLAPLLQAFDRTRYAQQPDPLPSQQALLFWRQFRAQAREGGWNL